MAQSQGHRPVTPVSGIHVLQGAAVRRWIALAEIVAEARERWPLQRVSVIHRVGELWPGDEIVFVGVTGAHRSQAFDAAQFIMDYLKTRAPFWKREATPEGDRWVEARDSDQAAAKRW